MSDEKKNAAVGHFTSPLGKADALLFGLFIAAILIKSITDLDFTWDSLNYHLPFAARRAGLIPAEVYQFQYWLEDCYKGIPAVPYYIYGFLWRVSGDINTPNIVSGIAFAGYCVFISRTFRAPLTLSAVAFAAIPIIQINLSSVYTDLVTNVCFAGGLVLVTMILAERKQPLLWRTLGALAFVSVSANFKTQFVALGGIFVAVFAIILSFVKDDGKSLLSMLGDELRRASLPVKALLPILVLLCYASALKNTIFYHNPLFPVGISVLGHHVLPGVTASEVYHEPRYLDGSPEIVQWTLSVLEYLSLGFRPTPYILGQGSVAADSQALRMGGYCAAFVLYNLGIFVWATLFSRTPRKALFGGFLALTAVVACLPSAHELRYYSFWMLYLVSMNIALLWKWEKDRDGCRHFAFVAVGVFVFVASITGWNAFTRKHFTVSDYIAALDLHSIYEPRLEDGQRYCLVNWAFSPMLGSSFFHKGHSYFAREADGADCPPGLVRMDLEQLRASAPAR